MEATAKVKRTNSINIRPLGIGSAMLLLGVLIYLLDRHPDQVFFIYALKLPYFHHPEHRRLFGEIGLNLPSFLHGCSFSLLICSMLPSQTKRNYFIVCVVWATISNLFEFGQLIKPLTIIYIPRFLLENSAFMHTINYFRYGTFDYMDILFAVLGCLFAYCILIITHKGGDHETSSTGIE